MAVHHDKFGVTDYCVFAGMLAISAVIGCYYAFFGSKKAPADSSTDEFIMGGRSMGVFPVAISVLASFLSAITLLGLPAEIYTFGTIYYAQIFSYPFIMAFTSYIFIPVFYELELTSSFEVMNYAPPQISIFAHTYAPGYNMQSNISLCLIVSAKKI